ncbi:MAG: SDR family NAD(P)-dependent oxidoreductase [Alphaproteobacteria bacterium]|nr:SDR family NAD(P)-dependent oxidoreductase [Alphaproteobacteria bacterium]
MGPRRSPARARRDRARHAHERQGPRQRPRQRPWQRPRGRRLLAARRLPPLRGPGRARHRLRSRPGRAIALRLGELGASVVVNSFHSREPRRGHDPALQDAGVDAFHAWGSAAQRSHLERIFAEIEERHGHLDFFINNASNGLIAPLEQVQEEHWERSFGTNVIGLHRGAMLARPDG